MWNRTKMQIPSAKHAVNLALQQIDQDDPVAKEAKRLRKRGKHFPKAPQRNLTNVEDTDWSPQHRRIPYHRIKTINWYNHLSDEEWWEDF